MDVWYVSYGSNLNEERFLCYISGERPPGSNSIEKGCQDKTPPKASELAKLPYPLYFAKTRSKWGEGGVAFIGHQKLQHAPTIARKYLITEAQFLEVVAQENNTSKVNIDLRETMELKYQKLDAGWYGRIMYLGDEDGAPMFTFTSNESIDNSTFNKPASAYLSTIATGMKELGYNEEDILAYFLNKSGIESHFSKETLSHYIFSR